MVATYSKKIMQIMNYATLGMFKRDHLHYFKVTAVSNCYTLKMLCSYLIKLKLCRIVKYIKQVMNISLFDFDSYSWEIIDIFPDFTNT